MDETHETAVVASFGEIGTKSKQVRRRMERRLRNNVHSMLADRNVPGDVAQLWSRILIETDEPERAARAAADVMGIVWARPALVCEPELDDICAALESAADVHGDETFAVRATRAGGEDEHDFSSRDIEVEGGRVVGETTGADVDLDDPGRTYHVEVRDGRAFVSATTHEGPGGLPLGTQDPMVALVSGGHDSPVAAWEVMRRGSPVIPVYVSLGDFGGPDHEARALATVRALARYAPNFDLSLHIVPAGDVVQTLMDEVDETRMLSLRRAMLRIAETVAEAEDAVGIVTGESLGQKSSQTAANLAVTDAAVTLPVHRPLVTRDKTDIIARARDIDTYDDSTLPVGCQQVDPTFPETRATLSQVRENEPDDVLESAAECASEMEVVDVE